METKCKNTRALLVWSYNLQSKCLQNMAAYVKKRCDVRSQYQHAKNMYNLLLLEDGFNLMIHRVIEISEQQQNNAISVLVQTKVHEAYIVSKYFKSWKMKTWNKRIVTENCKKSLCRNTESLYPRAEHKFHLFQGQVEITPTVEENVYQLSNQGSHNRVEGHQMTRFHSHDPNTSLQKVISREKKVYNLQGNELDTKLSANCYLPLNFAKSQPRIPLFLQEKLNINRNTSPRKEEETTERNLKNNCVLINYDDQDDYSNRQSLISEADSLEEVDFRKLQHLNSKQNKTEVQNNRYISLSSLDIGSVKECEDCLPLVCQTDCPTHRTYTVKQPVGVQHKLVPPDFYLTSNL
ncbi:uncharacterized protein [Periplaneta americana]